MMKALNLGVVGAGGRGVIARLAHQADNGVRIVAGADPSRKALDELREFVGGDFLATTDYRELVAAPNIDALFVAAPDFLHEEIAVAALEAGKAVYLEKPMAITLEGCDRILETAYRTGSKIFVGHNMRHFPVVLKMKELIDSGLIGEIQAGWCRHFVSYGGDAYFRDWHSDRRNTTGLLLQKGAHDIDVMHWLMGSSTRRVVGMGMLSVYDRCGRRAPDAPGVAKWSDSHWPPLEQTGFSPIIDVEDHNMVMMQLESGAQACYLQCHYTPDAERNYTFIGTRGRIENVGDYGACKIHVWTTRGPRATPDVVYNIKETDGSHGGSDPAILSEFVNFVREGGATNTSPVAARAAVAVGALGHASMRAGSVPQDVPPLSDELLNYFANGQRR